MQQQIDPYMILADTFLRMLVLDGLKAAIVAAAFAPLFYWHARWSRRK